MLTEDPQMAQCLSLVKATQELPASRGRNKSSTYPRRRAASRMALTLVTLAATRYPVQLLVEATVTATNGTNWGQVEAPVLTRVTQSPMAWEEEATFRERRPTVALTPALTEPLTMSTPTLIMAAPPRCWPPVEAETAGSVQHLRGTVQLREAAGYLRGHLLLLSLLALRGKGAWKGQVEVHLLISSSETAAPTV